MRRRSLLKALSTMPAASLMAGQQPVVPPKPNSVAAEQIPVIEATIPDVAGPTAHTYFAEPAYRALVRLSNLIAPASKDVPGALDAHVPEFLDFLIRVSPEDRQQQYTEGLTELNHRSQERFGAQFAELTAEQAHTTLAPLRAPWTARPDRFTAFLQSAKQDVLLATQGSPEWVHVMSKRSRSAGGLGTYWFPID